MARLIPAINVEDISIKPERDTARSLVESLPDNVLIYHSYPWLRSERNDNTGKVTIKEGEVDFVVVIPDLGFLVIEVKGGVIDFDLEECLWYRRLPSGDRREIKDPFKQANGNTHELKHRIVERAFPGLKYPPCAFGYAVVFPDCEYQGTAPPGADSAIILSAKDLPHLGRRIPEVLRKWSPKVPVPMSKEQLRGVRDALTSTFSLIPVLSRQIDEEEEHLVRLTEEQSRLLDYLQGHERCLIQGVAGSGKTLLALEQARRFAERGLKTLFVCYNKTLAQWILDSLSPSIRDLVDVFHFHSLCSRLCQEAGVSFSPPRTATERFYSSEAPNLLLEAIAVLGTKYDAMVVDEGQDFDSEWWLPLELLCHEEEKAPLFIFYDPAQKLFVDRISLPDLGKPYPLRTNCRNTRSIAGACASIREIDIVVHDAAPTGIKVDAYVCENAEEQRRKCESLLAGLRKGGLEPGQIVLQSPYRQENPDSSFSSITKIGGFPIVTDSRKWREGQGVLFTTIRSFKGLEADAVIMVDIPEPVDNAFFSTNDLYVGASRAKHILCVLGNSSEAILKITKMSIPE
ncbi:MAG: NERD domain-containing protein [Pseudomonadota bacterium]